MILVSWHFRRENRDSHGPLNQEGSSCRSSSSCLVHREDDFCAGTTGALWCYDSWRSCWYLGSCFRLFVYILCLWYSLRSFDDLWWSLKVQFAKITKSKYEGTSKTFAFEILWTSRVNRLDRLGVKNSNNSGSFCNVGSQVWWWLLLHLLIKLVMLRKSWAMRPMTSLKRWTGTMDCFSKLQALGHWGVGQGVSQ